ncbi:MAG: hypothetical protein GX799_01490 [Crenarchaeota archaeon]|jgi:hypothetical protein|nr:hypothetical protein [Thermoproteota archaeon]
MNTKLVLAITSIALVVIGLIGVTTAQFTSTQNTTNQNINRAHPPCTTNPEASPNWNNTTTGEPDCYNNCTHPSYCYNETNAGHCQNQYGNCYGYGYGSKQTQDYSEDMVGKNSYGRGCHK